MMKNQLIYSRHSKHWTTIIGIIFGLLFFSLGLTLLILQYKRVPLFLFGILFSSMGFFIFAISIYSYFIRPGLFILKIEHDKISWGVEGRAKEISFNAFEQINFEVMNGIVGDITVKFDNGDHTSFNNHITKLLSEKDMLEAFQFVNIHFEGKTLLNGV